MSLRIGALFAGYGGLDLAVADVLDAELAWVSEIEDAPSRILAHHYPHVPNHGDITAIDWTKVEPVDILTGGFPCQDVSTAGKRAGLRDGTRTGLWSRMAEAIDHLRPSLVVAENVRGLLSAEAHSEMEPCPWCVGGGPASGLRALGAVLGDLADIGYDASWCGLRAADVGAPHGRFRVFVVAWPAGDTALRHGRDEDTGRIQESSREGAVGGSDRKPAADTTESRLEGGEPQSIASPPGRRGVTTPDADYLGQQRGRGTRRRWQGPADGSFPATDTDRDGLESVGWIESIGRDVDGRDRTGQEVAWGPYGPAIRRWERVLGRHAPAPTEPGRNGKPRLSPRFVEWLMGLDDGWVTAVPGISRNDQLRALGSGVVPQQASEALRRLLADQVQGVAA